MKFTTLIGVLLLALAGRASAASDGPISTPALAQPAALRPSSPNRYFGALLRDTELSVHTGTFGAMDLEQVFEVGLELRFARQRALAERFSVRPVLGVSILDDGGNYSYLGLRGELDIDRRGDWTVGLTFAPGVYSAGGVDLGGPLEFRSGIDVGYRVYGDWRASVGLFHLSNGGIYSKNGGSESVLFSLSRKL